MCKQGALGSSRRRFRLAADRVYRMLTTATKACEARYLDSVRLREEEAARAARLEAERQRRMAMTKMQADARAKVAEDQRAMVCGPPPADLHGTLPPY
jgi:hypothetical protein